MQELFEGVVNFLQLKHALVYRVNSRVGRNRNTEYVPESVVDVQSFGAQLYDTVCSWPVVQCKKDQWVVVKIEPMREWIEPTAE